jgi:gephyrin
VEPRGCVKVKVCLDADVRLDKQRDEFHRVIVRVGDDGCLHAVSTGEQRSSRIGSFKGANALLCLSAGEGVVKKGEMVDALLMGGLVGGV